MTDRQAISHLFLSLRISLLTAYIDKFAVLLPAAQHVVHLRVDRHTDGSAHRASDSMDAYTRPATATHLQALA